MTESSAPSFVQRRGLQFMLLVIAAAEATYARAMLSPLQETISTALSLSDNQIALLQGPATALPMIAAAVPIGILIDRCSRARVIFAFSTLFCAGGVLTAAASSFPVLVLARSMVGIAVAAVVNAVFSLVADLYAPAQRGRASTAVCVAQYMGLSAAFALGGALIGRVGDDPEAWRVAMLWLNAPLVAITVSILLMREFPRTEVSAQNLSINDSFLTLWEHRSLIAPLLAGLIMADIAIFGVLAWATPAFMRGYDLSAERVAPIISASVLASGVLGPIVGGLLADACQRAGGPKRTMRSMAGLALLSCPAALFAIAPGPGMAGVLMALFMAMGGAMLVVGVTLFTIVIPNEVRGLCLSLSAGAQLILGVSAAPVAVSLVSGALGGGVMICHALTLVCLVVSLSAATIFFLGVGNFSGGKVR